MKTCPYCGEEIMATARKCKHCGEWLVEFPTLEKHHQPIRKESYFGSKYLYDKVWMNILLGITIIGSFIQSVHQSGLVVRESARSFLKYIRFAGEMPEGVGDLLYGAGEICFMVLLMKVFSHLHKPLKGWFITYIILSVLIVLITIGSRDSQDEEATLVLGLFGLLFFILMLLLPIMIVRHYEGNIKTLGWIMIGYSVAAITIGIVADYIVPIAGFFLIFLVDLFYYKYLKDILTKY